MIGPPAATRGHEEDSLCLGPTGRDVGREGEGELSFRFFERQRRSRLRVFSPIVDTQSFLTLSPSLPLFLSHLSERIPGACASPGVDDEHERGSRRRRREENDAVGVVAGSRLTAISNRRRRRRCRRCRSDSGSPSPAAKRQGRALH